MHFDKLCLIEFDNLLDFSLTLQRFSQFNQFSFTLQIFSQLSTNFINCDNALVENTHHTTLLSHPFARGLMAKL